MAPSLTWAHTGAAQSLSEALRHILLGLFSRRILLIQQNHCLDPPKTHSMLNSLLWVFSSPAAVCDCTAQLCCSEATGFTGLPNQNYNSSLCGLGGTSHFTHVQTPNPRTTEFSNTHQNQWAWTGLTPEPCWRPHHLCLCLLPPSFSVTLCI